jgi:K+-sensing histidine kinase KdpD
MLGTLESTLSMNTSGIGLGLSTCKKIAEAIHGDIFLMDDECQDHVSLVNSDRSSTMLPK